MCDSGDRGDDLKGVGGAPSSVNLICRTRAAKSLPLRSHHRYSRHLTMGASFRAQVFVLALCTADTGFYARTTTSGVIYVATQSESSGAPHSHTAPGAHRCVRPMTRRDAHTGKLSSRPLHVRPRPAPRGAFTRRTWLPIDGSPGEVLSLTLHTHTHTRDPTPRAARPGARPTLHIRRRPTHPD